MCRERAEIRSRVPDREVMAMGKNVALLDLGTRLRPCRRRSTATSSRSTPCWRAPDHRRAGVRDQGRPRDKCRAGARSSAIAEGAEQEAEEITRRSRSQADDRIEEANERPSSFATRPPRRRAERSRAPRPASASSRHTSTRCRRGAIAPLWSSWNCPGSSTSCWSETARTASRLLSRRRQHSPADGYFRPVPSPGVIKTADEITGEWLGSVLGADDLELIGVEAIGTGQMSRVYRASYRRPGGEPESVAVKLAATDQNSRDVGVNLGAYLREVTFYGELRDRIGGDGTLADATWPHTTRRRAGSRSSSRTSTTACRAIRSPAAGPTRRESRWWRWPGSTRRCSATSRSPRPIG